MFPHMQGGTSWFQIEPNGKRRGTGGWDTSLPSTLGVLKNVHFKSDLPGYYESMFVKVRGQTFSTEVADRT